MNIMNEWLAVKRVVRPQTQNTTKFHQPPTTAIYQRVMHDSQLESGPCGQQYDDSGREPDWLAQLRGTDSPHSACPADLVGIKAQQNKQRLKTRA